MPRGDIKRDIYMFNRRRDRMRNGYVMISDVELQEQGIDAEPYTLIGKQINYNGELRTVCSVGNDGILLEGQNPHERIVIHDSDFTRFLEGDPYFDCPCGKHYLSPAHYNFCMYGAGEYFYEVKNKEIVKWFKQHHKESKLIGRE